MSTPPFTFAWVEETDNTFDPVAMAKFDEDIFSFVIHHEEGQVPTLDITIRNPRIGLLNPNRKVWAWLAWKNPATHLLVPLYFGVLVGVPTNMFKELVTLSFISRSPTFIADKQAVAETMKVRPFWDPVWLDIGHRDDPDSILEGWSSLWHIDRKSLTITHSDILDGEDGTAVFTEDDAIYESVGLTLGQPPLSNIRVEATVNWTQRSSGFFAVPAVNMASYTGETLLSGWPKAGASIGGGYTCENSFTTDVFLVAQTPTSTYSSNWTNTDPNPGQCSNASASQSSSGPALMSPNPLMCILTSKSQSGVCFPDSDPPTNTPMTLSASGFLVPTWYVSMDMTLRYDASRQFTEVLVFDMQANTQGILTSPTVAQHTELLTLSSVDVGQPLIEVDAWTDFAGQPVGIAQVIFPNNPTTPGGLSYQICVHTGTAGTVEPVFSDFPGVITFDGGVQWASLGASPLTTAPRWSPASFVPPGEIVLLKNQVFNAASGNFEDIPGAVSYYMCTTGGKTNETYDTFRYTPPITSNTEPTPNERVISRIDPPPFSMIPGTVIRDNSVVWLVLGTMPTTLGIPIGGTEDDVRARSYFPTDRGLWSTEYLLSRARARLRFRARAVKVVWDCPFDLAVPLSCRMNASIADPRLPGGTASGKITGYTLSAAGDGKLRGHVEIGCAIGFGDSVVEIEGTPEYVDEDYVADDYQIFDGAMAATASFDVLYAPPVFTGYDDGLVFPLQWKDVSDGGVQSGTLTEQADAIQASFKAEVILQYLSAFGGSISTGNSSSSVTGVAPDAAWKIVEEQLALLTQTTPYVMEANPISWSMLLKPCAGNGPFSGAYSMVVSPLVLSQGINLEAPSSP